MSKSRTTDLGIAQSEAEAATRNFKVASAKLKSAQDAYDRALEAHRVATQILEGAMRTVKENTRV